SQDQAGARRQGAALPRTPPAPCQDATHVNPPSSLPLTPGSKTSRAASPGGCHRGCAAGPACGRNRCSRTGSARVTGARISGLLDQDGTGVEQIEALTLRVLLRLRSWLGGDDGHVAASGGSVGEPGGQQRGLHTTAAVRRDGRRASE